MVIRQNLSLLPVLRATWKMDIVLALTCFATYVLHAYIIPDAIRIPGTVVAILGPAIAFFVGFSNNQAYDRWWEARTIWGSLVNDCRSWARNILSYTRESEVEYGEINQIKKRMILRQISFVYALNKDLRRKEHGYFEKYLTVAELAKVRLETNLSNAILTLNAQDTQKLSSIKAIDEFRFMQLNELITSFTDHMGRSERIRNTVFPTSYIYFTQLFIWVLVVFTTLILADSIGIWSVLIGWIMGFVFHITHQNGMLIMDPFDEIPSGIPLDQLCRTIEINLLEMLGETDIPQPIKPVNDEYIL